MFEKWDPKILLWNSRGEEGAYAADADVQEARHALHEHQDDGAHAVRIAQRLHTVPGMSRNAAELSLAIFVQLGDLSQCSTPPVDIKTKVTF